MKNIIAVLCWFIPFKNIRHRLKVKYVKSKRIKYHNNNRIIIHMPNGDTVINPYSIPGLEVSFEGANSTIELFYPIRFHKSNFMCKDDCSIVIKQSCFMGLTVDMYNNTSVFIDENCQIGECHVAMPNEQNTSLHMEPDCVLSTGIEIWTTDAHPIFDMKGKCINNRKSCVKIGRHTWICRNATLLKGAQIAPNSIVGHSSVVSSKFTDENVVIAGNPAQIVKHDINWSGGKID